MKHRSCTYSTAVACLAAGLDCTSVCILRDSFNHLRFRTSNKWLFLFPWSRQTTVLGSREIMCTNPIFTMTSPLYFECNFGVNSHSSSPVHWIASFPGCGRKWHGKFGKFKLIWKFTMTIIWLLIWVKGYSPVQSTEQTWHLFQDLYEYLYVFYGVQLIRMTKKTWRATRSIHQKGITLGTIHLRVFPWPTRLLVALRSITKVLNQKVAKRPKSVSYFFHHTG